MSARDDGAVCPACGGVGLEVFHRERGVPSHSCILLDDVEEARAFPKGDISLGLCHTCGFITNTAFDPGLSAYSARYEETQGFSPRFQAFAAQLAKRWVEEYDLHDKTILEIGCGKGEFLVQMVEHGAGAGIGIDPGVNPARIQSSAADRLTWISDLFSERYLDLAADAIVCRHTLEHISPVGEFLSLVRRSIGDRLDAVVLFELPDVLRVLRETAFWDVYYEHCSYFSIGSLVRLFRRSGFAVDDARLEYDDQYIVLEARPVAIEPAPASVIAGEDDIAELAAVAAAFEREYGSTLEYWRAKLATLALRGERAVIWGGGSKGVAFLNALGRDAAIEHVVDINPFKQGKRMAGEGQLVVAPDFLRERKPDVVIAMNPTYRDEIRATLDDLGLHPKLWSV